jgi:hypothetical protein
MILVMASFNLKSVPSSKPPKYCTKYFVEFGGRQQKMSAFFTQNSAEMCRTISSSQNSEKRKIEENGTESILAPKKSKIVPQQQQQQSLLSFFKPKNPAKPKQEDPPALVQSQENENISQIEEINPEKRVQVTVLLK